MKFSERLNLYNEAEAQFLAAHPDVDPEKVFDTGVVFMPEADGTHSFSYFEELDM